MLASCLGLPCHHFLRMLLVRAADGGDDDERKMSGTREAGDVVDRLPFRVMRSSAAPYFQWSSSGFTLFVARSNCHSNLLLFIYYMLCGSSSGSFAFGDWNRAPIRIFALVASALAIFSGQTLAGNMIPWITIMRMHLAASLTGSGPATKFWTVVQSATRHTFYSGGKAGCSPSVTSAGQCIL
ncbi:hypothetical protein FB451DRAFT_1176690 [Mycena latifolia]|nr:hypothetical protein FB451DRAFT_1176690 [Mycena latifolia]